MNHKRLDYCKSSKIEEPKDIKNSQNKQDTALVSVGMKKIMKSGYWSKKPGQKAMHISLPARQSYRKGPVRSKTTKCYNNKPMLRCSKTGKYMRNKDRKNRHKCKFAYQIKHYDSDIKS